MAKPTLHIAPCSYAEARVAVMRWHYSKAMPTPPLMSYGVVENGRHIGAVIFGRGANNNLYRAYGLDFAEGRELVRVALDEHETPVSRIVAIALRLLKRHMPDVRLVVSFADPQHAHIGGIYQAGGWVYGGRTACSSQYIDATGRRWHGRQVSSTGRKKIYGEWRQVPRIADCTRVREPAKYRYLMPLDDAMRAQIAPLAQPYPKRETSCVTSLDSETLPVQGRDGGASPTVTLQAIHSATLVEAA